jgi:hypothetical protein
MVNSGTAGTAPGHKPNSGPVLVLAFWRKKLVAANLRIRY